MLLATILRVVSLLLPVILLLLVLLRISAAKLAGLEGLSGGLERGSTRSEAAGGRVHVELLLSLLGEVLVLGSRIVLPRVEVRHGGECSIFLVAWRGCSRVVDGQTRGFSVCQPVRDLINGELSSTVRGLWSNRHADSGLGVESDGRRLAGFMVQVVKIRAPPRQRHDIAKGGRLCGGAATVHFAALGTVHRWACSRPQQTTTGRPMSQGITNILG